MHGLRFDRILTGTAIALVLSLAPAMAGDQTNIDALVPIPEAADVPPPSINDIGPVTTATVPASVATPSAVTTAAAPPASEPAVAPPTSQPPAAQPAQAAPAPAQDTAVAVPSVDAPTVDALRDLVTTKLARMTDRKADRAAIEAFYSGRNYAPLWIANGAANARAKAAIAHLNGADADGLDPADYPTPAIKAGADPATLADAEMRLTLSALTYARQATMGRVHYSRISADITYNQVAPEPAEVLARLAGTTDVDAALESYQPPQAEYKALRAKLAEIRGNKSDPNAGRIASGPVLELRKDKRGNVTLMQDDRVTALRARLGLPAVSGDTFYDKPLADAVAEFQKEKGLKASGTLTAATIDALNGRARNTARDADIIVVNMERWRWLPRDLGKAHVVLNIPDYTLQVYNNGASIWKTRVVVGKPGQHATPLLSETMKYITVNPTWNVPPSIVYNEYLPALKQDPDALKRIGLNLVQNKDGSVHISQPPGDGNALGRIRFNFPNKFLVYQHDTPDKYLFAKETRAYSHGCMRVQDPAKYAEVMSGLGMPGHGYTQDQIKAMYGHSEVDLRFTNPIPVHITYQTAFVDENGKLQIRDDVYGRDSTMVAALKNTDKRIAEIPVEHAQPNYARPNVKLPNEYSNNGPSFFDRLFGNPVRPEPTVTTRQPQRRQTRADAAPAPARGSWMDRTR